VCREASIPRSRNRLWGSGTAGHPALLDAVLCAVHAGGEQGWESGHLEPLLFCPYLLLPRPRTSAHKIRPDHTRPYQTIPDQTRPGLVCCVMMKACWSGIFPKQNPNFRH
jgi:hypothetical protein